MCAPIATIAAVTSAIAGVAGTATSVYSIQQQQSYNKKLGINARVDANNKNAALGLRLAQEREAAAQDLNKAGRKTRRAIAANMLGADSAGVSGLSVDMLNANFARQQDEYRSAVMRNLDFKEAQFMLDTKGVAAQYANQSQPKPIDYSGIGSGLSFASDTMDKIDSIKNPK